MARLSRSMKQKNYIKIQYRDCDIPFDDLGINDINASKICKECGSQMVLIRERRPEAWGCPCYENIWICPNCRE